ncbi:uncharacterized protein LOC134242289 [Saccostrea cucullata]|uniref:uncharacterized protein LOC134242289 n=1 Tax=Saccostrea cuccullata TaxID=36930 RepID=UPI002ED2124F
MMIIICSVLALVFIVLGMVYYLRSKVMEKGSNTNIDATESSPSENACSVQQEQGECIYNDVRESRMIENTRMFRPENASMQNRSKVMEACMSVPKQRREKVQESISSSLDLGYYGGCGDNYSRLQLKKIRTCTLPSKSPVNMNDYAWMKPNLLSVSHENIYTERGHFKEGEYANQSLKENPIIARSGVNQ